jgi:rubredoxin/uncharacterized membrane protein
MKQWKCRVCGYIHTGEKPPAKCPVCGAPASAFDLIDAPGNEPQNSTTSGKNADPVGEASQSGPQRQWRCTVCGYIHTGSAPPEKCPVCGAPRERFEPVEEIAPTVEPEPVSDAAPADQATADVPPEKATPLSQITARAELLTKLHGHPIAVHIPNGVLPLTFLFTLLAVAFKSDGLATAARYNMIFVCLSMPVVLMTGVIDWFNRFNAQLTIVFKIKMACGAAVTVLSLILALWWTVQPGVYLGGQANTGLFLFLNFLDLGIAAVAGFYGGKLVFRE